MSNQEWVRSVSVSRVTKSVLVSYRHSLKFWEDGIKVLQELNHVCCCLIQFVQVTVRRNDRQAGARRLIDYGLSGPYEWVVMGACE